MLAFPCGDICDLAFFTPKWYCSPARRVYCARFWLVNWLGLNSLYVLLTIEMIIVHLVVISNPLQLQCEAPQATLLLCLNRHLVPHWRFIFNERSNLSKFGVCCWLGFSGSCSSAERRMQLRKVLVRATVGVGSCWSDLWRNRAALAVSLPRDESPCVLGPVQLALL